MEALLLVAREKLKEEVFKGPDPDKALCNILHAEKKALEEELKDLPVPRTPGFIRNEVEEGKGKNQGETSCMLSNREASGCVDYRVEPASGGGDDEDRRHGS